MDDADTPTSDLSQSVLGRVRAYDIRDRTALEQSIEREVALLSRSQVHLFTRYFTSQPFIAYKSGQTYHIYSKSDVFDLLSPVRLRLRIGDTPIHPQPKAYVCIETDPFHRWRWCMFKVYMGCILFAGGASGILNLIYGTINKRVDHVVVGIVVLAFLVGAYWIYVLFKQSKRFGNRKRRDIARLQELANELLNSNEA